MDNFVTCPPEPGVLILDCDGVLTDCHFSACEQGIKHKRFHCRDAPAIRRLAAAGWEIHIVTNSKWPGIVKVVRNWPVTLHWGCDKTPDDIAAIVNGRDYVAVGDDWQDLDILRGAKRAFCPADAALCVRIGLERHVRVLNALGGDGVIAEVADILLGA